MGWTFQEAGAASAIKSKLAAMPKCQDAGEESVRQAVAGVINAAMADAKGEVHVNVHASGHSQAPKHSDEQLKNAPHLKDARQVFVTLSIQTSV